VNPCPAGKRFESVLIHATATDPTLVSSLGTVLCEKSLTHIDVEGTSGSPLKGTVLELTFVNCNLGGTACTVTVERLPYLGLLTATSGGNGTLTVESGGSGNPRALVDCGSSALKCFFGAEKTKLAVTGGNPATAKANGIEFEREGGSGFLCPASSKWNATYTLTEPAEAMFVEAEP